MMLSRFTHNPVVRRALLAITLSSVIQVALSALEYKLPSTDFFVFKEAGVNLALTGKFHVMNLPHMQPEESHIFSYYPPAYPFAFGVWSKAFGVGLFQSSLFDLTWRTLRTALMIFLLLMVANREIALSRLSLLFLVVVCAISTDADRPDEMALSFALLSWSMYLGSRFRLLFAGLFLGLCMAASPTGGVFTGLGLFFLVLSREGFRFFTFLRLTGIAVMGAALFFSVTLPIVFADPVAYQTFSRQVPLSTFPWIEPWVAGQGLKACWVKFLFYFLPWFSITLPYVFAGGVSLLAAFITYIKVGKEGRKNVGWAFHLGVAFTAAVVLVWTRQPYYLWFPTIALFLFTLMAVSLYPKETGKTGYASILVLMLALSPLCFRESKAILNALERPRGESPEAIREKVLAYVGPKERIAITPDQYFTFRNYREIANLRYMCDRLDAFEYLYVSRLLSAKRGTAGPIPIPCESPSPKCFDAVADFSTNRVFTILGKETDYYVRGSGGTLYQNRRCTASMRGRLTQHP